MMMLNCIFKLPFNIEFNSALCFFLIGMCFYLTEHVANLHTRTYVSTGIFITIFAALILSQDIYHYSLGIDQAFCSSSEDIDTLYPGRMSNFTTIGFMLVGLTAILLPFTMNKFFAFFYQAFAFFVLLLGLAATAKDLFNIDILYAHHYHSGISISSAVCFVLVGLNFGLVWKDSLSFHNFYHKHDDKRIILLSIAILFSIAVVATMTGFITATRQNQLIISSFLTDVLNSKTQLINENINSATIDFNNLRNDKTLNDILINQKVMTPKLTNDLKTIITTSHFSAVQITNNYNDIIYSSGTMHKNAKSSFNLQNYPASLFWSDGFYLRFSGDISKNNQKIGTIIAESPVTILNDTVELNLPLFNQLKTILISLILITGIGTLLFYLLVNPFVKRIMQLKRKALISKVRLRAIMDHVVDGILTIDIHGIIETANPKAAEMFGYSSSEIIGTKIKSLLPSLTEIKLNGLVDAKPVLNILHFMKNHPIEIFGLRKNGDSFSAEVAISDLYLGKQHLYVCIIRDISQRKAAEARLQESEAQFRSAFDTAPIGMALISLRGKVTQINSSLCQILGYTESELKQMNLNSITHPEDLKISEEKQSEILANKTKDIQFVKRFYHKNGHIIWVLLNASVICNSNGKPLQLIAQIQDITKQKEEEEKLNYKAHYDTLTGLVNRNYLELNLNHVIANAQRNAKKFAIFFLDLDNFKTINDTLGHDAGDALLKIVAERLLHHTRKSDIVARLGGDEFILVLTELQEFQIAASFGERIIKTIQKPLTLKGQEMSISTSIGISFYPTDGTDAVTLIKNADHALYRAKEKGRNNFQFCTNEVSTQIQQTIEFENSMQQALNKQEFHIYYLPVVKAETNTVTGVEALLRWQSQQYGLINPQQIIPIAEETGFIVPLSEWIIKTACQQVLKFQKDLDPNLRLCVNISARQFMHNQLIDSVFSSLNQTQFDPAFFTLEISENLIMQDPKLSLDTIASLRKKGIHVVIDNFGSGYSSLPYLQDFKVDAIKIDRTLIQQIGINAERTNLIVAIIVLAKNLGIKVIAAGVETKVQYEFLIARGCDELQGYYICMPVAAHDFREFMNSKENEILQLSD